MTSIDLCADKFARNITLSIRFRGLKTMKLRWWLTTHLLSITAYVSGMNIEVEMLDDDRRHRREGH